MKRFLVFLYLGLLTTSALGQTLTRTSSSDKSLGVGVAFSGPVGLSLYGKVSDSNFLQGAVAWGRGGSMAATADYAVGYQGVISGIPALTPFWGLGVVTLFDRGDYWVNSYKREGSVAFVGGRIPLGFNIIIPRTPIQLGAEVAPTLLFTPVSYSYVQGGVNVRMMF